MVTSCIVFRQTDDRRCPPFWLVLRCASQSEARDFVLWLPPTANPTFPWPSWSPSYRWVHHTAEAAVCESRREPAPLVVVPRLKVHGVGESTDERAPTFRRGTD